jgi:hypothetical protein
MSHELHKQTYFKGSKKQKQTYFSSAQCISYAKICVVTKIVSGVGCAKGSCWHKRLLILDLSFDEL